MYIYKYIYIYIISIYIYIYIYQYIYIYIYIIYMYIYIHHLFTCPKTNIGPRRRRQPHSPYVYHSIITSSTKRLLGAS